MCDFCNFMSFKKIVHCLYIKKKKKKLKETRTCETTLREIECSIALPKLPISNNKMY